MAETTLEEIRRLNFEDLLWVIFIILAILDIVGDRKQKEYLRSSNIQKAKDAKRIYITIVVITVLLYLYFVARNYYFYKLSIHTEDERIEFIRYIGSIALLGGSFLLLYYQVNTKISEGGAII